jgi:hypothetical protein
MILGRERFRRMNKKGIYFDFVFKNKSRGKAALSGFTFPALEIAIKGETGILPYGLWQ